MSNKEKYLAAKKAAELAAKLPELENSTPLYVLRMKRNQKQIKHRKYKSNRAVNKTRRELFESGETIIID